MFSRASKGIMFIKKIKKKHLNTDKNYFVFQLFDEVEVNGRKKQKMVLSLGSKLGIPESEHQNLASAIESLVRHKKISGEVSKEIETLAEEFSKQLLKRENARRKRPGLKSLKKSSSFKKRVSFDGEEDFEPKKQSTGFRNKPLAFNKIHKSKSDRFIKKDSSDTQDDFKPRRTSRFGNRKDFSKDDRKGSYSLNRKSSFGEDSSDSQDDFKPRRTSRFGNKQEQDRSSDRRSSFKDKFQSRSATSDERKPRSNFGSKKPASKFGQRPERKSFSKGKKSFSRFSKKRED
jgi:hypothetical protein